MSDSPAHFKQNLISPQDIPDYDVEHSETLLYHVRLLEDMGETSEALTLLDTSAKSRSIVDRTAIMTLRGALAPYEVTLHI
jgi:N-alpha-acetyltransferase 15/16, NatA auxiliary subunit